MAMFFQKKAVFLHKISLHPLPQHPRLSHLQLHLNSTSGPRQLHVKSTKMRSESGLEAEKNGIQKDWKK